jgi:hypothetical protein
MTLAASAGGVRGLADVVPLPIAAGWPRPAGHSRLIAWPGSIQSARLKGAPQWSGRSPTRPAAVQGILDRRNMLQILRRGGLNRGPSTYRVFPYPMS